MAVAPILRDYLIRYQQAALKETGRRPMAFRRTPMDEKLVLPGCNRPGYAFWQPIPWPNNDPPLGPHAERFHATIREYLSLCQFLEIRFSLPVTPTGSPVSYLHGRVFDTYKNTESAPPSQAFEEALWLSRESDALPLSYPMAATSDAGEPVLLLLRAEDGLAFLQRANGDRLPTNLKLTVDRLLPKVKFFYGI